MPQLFNIFRIVAKGLGERKFCQSCRDADPESPGQELEQGPALVRIHAIKPVRDLLRQARPRCYFDHVDNFAEAQWRATSASIRPHKRKGLSRVAHVIARIFEEDRVKARGREFGEDPPQRNGDRHFVGECCKCKAPVRVRAT